MSEYNAKCSCGKCHNTKINTDNNETELDKSSDASSFKTNKFTATIFFIEIVKNFCFQGQGSKIFEIF